MRPALKAALDRIRAVLLAAAAGGAARWAGQRRCDRGRAAVLGTAEQRRWAEAQQRHDRAAYQRYLELYPTGHYAEEAFRSIIERSFRRSRSGAWSTSNRPGPGGPASSGWFRDALALY